jgi:hypothetical protein
MHSQGVVIGSINSRDIVLRASKPDTSQTPASETDRAKAFQNSWVRDVEFDGSLDGSMQVEEMEGFMALHCHHGVF